MGLLLLPVQIMLSEQFPPSSLLKPSLLSPDSGQAALPPMSLRKWSGENSLFHIIHSILLHSTLCIMHPTLFLEIPILSHNLRILLCLVNWSLTLSSEPSQQPLPVSFHAPGIAYTSWKTESCSEPWDPSGSHLLFTPSRPKVSPLSFLLMDNMPWGHCPWWNMYSLTAR